MNMNGMFLKGMLAAVFLFPLAAGAAPAANAGPDQTVLDREGDSAEMVVLDSSASTGSITAWEWKNGDTVLSTEIRCLATLPVGTNTVTLTVTDDQAQTAIDTLQVVINPLSGPKQRRNLKDRPTANRFVRPMNLVWPSVAGATDICLWKDDQFAAFSLSVDDNCVQNHDFWVDICNQYGWKMTWFVVTVSVTNNPSFSGPWSAFQRLADLGHDIQSHTVNHYSNGADRTDAEMIVQYRDAIVAIESNLTNVCVTTVGYAYGSYKREPAAMFHLAGRGPSSFSKPERTDYLQTGATSSGANPAYIDATLYGTSSISWLNTTDCLRGWNVGVYHYVNAVDIPLRVAEMEYLASKTNLWVGTFTEVAKYGQERDTVTLTLLTNSADGVRFTLSDEMDDTLFDYPLTVKVKMHPGWLGVQATQNGTAIESKVVNYNGDLYALVQAVPDQGEILLTPASAAGFTASPVSGWAPLTVTFTDTSTISGITNRFWDFGDGFATNTSATEITHTCMSAGTCTVQMIVSSPGGTDTNTQPNLIRITLPVAPSAAFSVSPSSGWAPLAVTFTDASTGSITNRFWDFGDGATTNTGTTNVSHVYTSGGTNTVQLIVSGPAGSSTNTATVTVTLPVAPSAAFSASPVSGTIPLAVTFTDTSTGTITNRSWNFGDGATTNTGATNVSHAYTSAGNKTVTLVVSGPAGVSTNVQTNLISVESSSSGPLVVYDPFLEATNKLGSVGGWAPAGWTATDLTTAQANAYIREGSLTVAGLKASEGNSLGLSAKGGDYYLDFNTVTLGTGDTIYFSFIQKFNVIAGSTMTGASGYIRLGNSADASSVTKGIYICRGSAGAPAASNAGFGLSAKSSTYTDLSASFKTSGTYDMTATYFIVGSYTRGSGATDGSLKLWINPDSATFGTANAPAPTVSMASLSSADTFNRLFINANGSTSWPIDWQLDEVRIGTGWAQVAPSENSAPNPDSNGNGILDSWEVQYFGVVTNINPAALAANGVNTIYETYIAGLNPTNPAAIFNLSAAQNRLQWNAVSGRVYSVYWTTNLLDSFQPLETNIFWPQSGWTDTVHGVQGGGFYRIKVQLGN